MKLTVCLSHLFFWTACLLCRVSSRVAGEVPPDMDVSRKSSRGRELQTAAPCYKSCSDALLYGVTSNGIQQICPTGDPADMEYTANCNQATAGGGWMLFLAYRHNPMETNPLVPGVLPTNPNGGYSHKMVSGLGYQFQEIESIRFFCLGTIRIVHFSTNNTQVKQMAWSGDQSSNSVGAWWPSDTTLEAGHSAFLPMATDFASTNPGGDLTDNPFASIGSNNFWTINGPSNEFDCDEDSGGPFLDTYHQIWVRFYPACYVDCVDVLANGHIADQLYPLCANPLNPWEAIDEFCDLTALMASLTPSMVPPSPSPSSMPSTGPSGVPSSQPSVSPVEAGFPITCLNLPTQQIAVQLTNTGVPSFFKCEDIMEGAPNCNDALWTGGEYVWQVCQNQCYLITNCPPPPTAEPSPSPSFAPSTVPSSAPSPGPSPMPSPAPTPGPSQTTTFSPTAVPSPSPSPAPSKMPSSAPSPGPSPMPSPDPTSGPSQTTTFSPTAVATPMPSPAPSTLPSPAPSSVPSQITSFSPTTKPVSSLFDPATVSPTEAKTDTNVPTVALTAAPVDTPAVSTTPPTAAPKEITADTDSPTISPSVKPVVTIEQTSAPTVAQTTDAPTGSPTATQVKTAKPSEVPSMEPTDIASLQPSHTPSTKPSRSPTPNPTTSSTKEQEAADEKPPVNQPSLSPGFSAPSSRPASSIEFTAVPSLGPTPTPVIDVTFKGVRIIIRRCRRLLSAQELEEFFGLLRSFFLNFYGADGEERRLQRRRDARNIQSVFTFVDQRLVDETGGATSNEVIYDHRLIYDDPHGTSLISFTAEEQEEVKDVVDIDNLTPDEIAVRPFEDLDASYELTTELRDNIDVLKESEGVTVPAIPEEQKKKIAEETGSSVSNASIESAKVKTKDKRIEPVTLSVILMTVGFATVIASFVVWKNFIQAPKYSY